MQLKIVRIHNELLGTYGDRGNADVLAYRAGFNGIVAHIEDVSYRDSLPSDGDIYLLGGAEDAAQVLSCEALRGFDFSEKVVLASCGERHSCCITSKGDLITFGRSIYARDQRSRKIEVDFLRPKKLCK